MNKVKILLGILMMSLLLSGCSMSTDKLEEAVNTLTTSEDPQSKTVDTSGFSDEAIDAINDAQKYYDAAVTQAKARGYKAGKKSTNGFFKRIGWQFFDGDGWSNNLTRASSLVKVPAYKHASDKSFEKLQKNGTSEEIAYVQKIREDAESAYDEAYNDSRESVVTSSMVDKIKKKVPMLIVLVVVIVLVFLIIYLMGATFNKTKTYAAPRVAPQLPTPSRSVEVKSTRYIRTREYQAIEEYCRQNGIDVNTFIQESGGIHNAYARVTG